MMYFRKSEPYNGLLCCTAIIFQLARHCVGSAGVGVVEVIELEVTGDYAIDFCFGLGCDICGHVDCHNLLLEVIEFPFEEDLKRLVLGTGAVFI